MGTWYRVIITPTKIYGTYHKTICFEEAYKNENEDDKWKVIYDARAVVFGYALYSSRCQLEEIELLDAKNEQDIFTYLEKQ